MKILYNGGLYGREALCYQGREIIKQLAKYHTISIDSQPVAGYWKKYYGKVKKGEEDIYLLNAHTKTIPYFISQGHKKIINICVLETKLPTDWIEALNMPEVKEIWTISEFCKELIINSGVKKPVRTIYIGLDKRFRKKGINLFPKDKTFKFLNICAPHCLGKKDRKGLDILLPAFKEEFGDNPKITLLLKINPIYADNFNRRIGRRFNMYEYLKSLLPKGTNLSNIATIIDYYNTEWINNLYESIDCGVFPSRAEGFGLPQAEMASKGIPVITSDYGATNEFSYPGLRIKIKEMKPLDYKASPYYNSLFAEADKEELKRLMRLVYNCYEEAKESAEEHSKNFKKFDWDKIGKEHFNRRLDQNEKN